jgi:hypothetical protein
LFSTRTEWFTAISEFSVAFGCNYWLALTHSS